MLRAQSADSNQVHADTTFHPWSANHSFNATNNGVSIVPAFTLGRPAFIYTSSFGNGTFRIEPEVRMSYDFEPWTVLCWGRYILPSKSKWNFTLASHYALLFAPLETPTNTGIDRSYNAHRYLAGQITASRPLGGGYTFRYFALTAHGWFEGANPYFTTLNSVGLGMPELRRNKLKVQLAPQLYTLNFLGSAGFFYSTNYALRWDQSKWSLTGMISQPLVKEASLTVAPVVWNVGLTYNVSHTHQKLQFPTL
jgi:hypothetical protein